MAQHLTVTYGDGSTQDVAVTVVADALPPTQTSFSSKTFVVGKTSGRQATLTLQPGAVSNPAPPPPPPPPPPPAAPTCSTRPIMEGSNAPPNGIIVTPGKWSSGTVATQLLRNGVSVGAANAHTTWATAYDLTAADEGATFSGNETATASGVTSAPVTTTNQIVVVSPSPTPTPTPTPTPSGAPQIVVPSGFQAITQYANPVKAYDFTGSKTSPDWVPRNGTNDGMAVTQYESSQVQPGVDGLHIVAEHKTSPDGRFPYISGCVMTSGAVTVMHGLLQYRAKMPAGQGLWPGLWGHNGVGTAIETMEIDVMEMLLGNVRTVYGSAHQWNGWTHVWGETQSGQLSSDATNFHDYQLVWQPGLLTWAIDGRAYAQYSQAQAQAAGHSWVFEQAMFLVVGIGVAGANEWGGAPNSSTQFPAAMVLESVKVWQ